MTETQPPKKLRKARRADEALVAEKLLNLQTMTKVVSTLVALDPEAAELLRIKLERAKPKG